MGAELRSAAAGFGSGRATCTISSCRRRRSDPSRKVRGTNVGGGRSRVSSYARVVLMSIARLKAQGQKWYRWYSRTRRISEEKVKKFPRRYRKRRLMTTTATAEYEISEVLLREYDSVKQDRL